jgi:hypothetical protein
LFISSLLSFIDHQNFCIAGGGVKYNGERVMTLNDIYSFITGSRILPLCWEKRKISVCFLNVSAGEQPRLPTSATCTNTLHLAVCKTADELKGLWLTVFENGSSLEINNC